ncbi:MAG: crotonase [Hydrocarboniphaga sp.]|uniref:enoyl-CoA hydratase/isomerase family protein n=1 Tax=Hydrocarboniphaga sp. TaxID=2033016 RepID=UPI002605507C|nr:enoyl-CoA hydratase/isomerase family protein [Hydrocarboniphaga sp.]MDB5970153.1 crotonase [Hydrocarboniphaga sp.]
MTAATSTTEPGLLIQRPADGVALVLINRPAARNALDIATQQQLDEALRGLAADENVRAIVITGAGDQSFSAGYDLKEMQHFDTEALMLAQLRREPWIWAIAQYPKPLIGAINGHAHGAGAIIAAALDIRVGCSRSDFRFTAINYGGANNTWQLPKVVGLAKAKEFIMTGRNIGPTEALQAGLLNHVVADDQLLAKAVEIAALIAAHSSEALYHVKALMHDNFGRGYEEAYRAENAVMMNELKPAPPAQSFEKFLKK